VAAAAFYSGLQARGSRALAAHRPAVVFSYMQHHSFEPSFVVDVTTAWEAKLAALAAYRSQLYQPGGGGDGAATTPAGEAAGERSGPPTKVSSREFRLAVEGRARHFGQMIGAELGEPFWSPQPLAVADLLALVPRGPR
jgi:LmbE family N-acetylglucosaminyl deacetylase